MEVHFSPDKEARLQDFAARNRKNAAQVVEEAVDGVLEHDSRLTEAVEYVRAAARRATSVFAHTGHSTPGSVVIRVVALIVVLAMIGVPLSLVASKHLGSPNLWFDESGQYWLSRGLHQFSAPLTPSGSWGNIVEFGRVMNADPSGFTAILRLWIDVFGSSPLVLRSLPFLFFLLIPVTIILAALRCGANPVVAVLAGSIPLGAPMMLHYATEVRAYSMEACAVAFLFFLPCWLSEERRKSTAIILGCVAAVLVASRYSAFIFGAAACLTALLPLRPLRGGLLRALRFGIPVVISAAACYLLFARYQVGGSYHAPFYVETLLLSGKSTAAQLARLRENLLGSYGIPILSFLVAAPLFFWLGPRSLARLRSLVGRMAVFCALSVTFTFAASLAGMLPWAVHSRWAIGYQSLSACCGAMIVIATGICLCRWVAGWPRKKLVIAAAACFAVAWSIQLKQALAVERPYYETIGSHLEVLAGSPHAKDLRFFVNHHAIPTTRYLCEVGPFKGAFNYPKSFHFETEDEQKNAVPISADDYDVVVLTQIPDAVPYRMRVAGGTAELRAAPWPSCLLIVKKAIATSEPGARNLALFKQARQSSTFGPWGPDKGVDGFRSSPGWFGGFHTANEANPWWEVDLGAVYRLTEVRLYNAPPYARAATLRMLLSQDDRNWTEVYSNAGRPFDAGPRVVNLNGNRARYVRVQLSDRTWLHLDEVEVYGTEP